MHADAQAISTEAFLWTIGSVCRLHRAAFDPAIVLGQFPGPHTRASLLRALKQLGFEIRARRFRPKRRALPPPPILAWRSLPVPHEQDDARSAANGEGSAAERGVDGKSAEPGAADAPHSEAGKNTDAQPALIVSADAKRIAFFSPASREPEVASVDDFGLHFAPEVLTIRRAQPLAEEGADAVADAIRPKFGFRWFIPELLRHKRIWRDVLIASAAIQLLGLGIPLFTQVVIDKVVVNQTMSTLVVVGTGMAIFVVFSGIMTWLRQYLVNHTGNRIDAVLGARVFRHLFRLPIPYFQNRPTGTLVARLQGVEAIRRFVSGAAITLFLDIPMMVILLAVMFVYSWQLTLIAVGILFVIAVLSLLVTPLFRTRLNEQFLLGARNQAYVTEYVAGIETVKSLQMEPQLESRYGDLLANYLRATFNTRQLANSYNTTANTLEQALALCILMMGALLVMENAGFTVGMLVAFQMFAGRLTQPVLRLVGLYQEFQEADVAVKRLGDVLDMPSEPYGLVPRREQARSGAEIDISGLSFRYSPNHPFLYRNLDLKIQSGSMIAIMGPSGSGKSTLAKLMQGFYVPTEGAIKINGLDVQQMSANELRCYFGIVPQETILFSGTVYDNLAAANPLANFEDIATACKMAEIHHFIEQLPKGYQTEIGERGIGLSGGQKQRVAIARALLKRPKVLILDEATSNLDARTAEQLGRTIASLRGHATIVFITHQLPRAVNVDATVSIS